MNHRLSDLCRALGVSAGGYPAWKTRAPSARAVTDVALAAVIAATHHEFRERYGSRRLRRAHGLWSRRRRRFVRTRAAYQRTPAAPRLCTWPFAADAPDRLWVGDIVSFPSRQTSHN